MTRGKLWKILNEPITIWALSSIVVGSFGAAYSHLTARLETEHEKNRQIERLQAQVGIRAEYAAALAKNSADGRKLLDTLLMDTPETRLGPDFKGRSTLAIEYELEQLCGACGTTVERLQQVKDLIGEAMLLRARLSDRELPDLSLSGRARQIVEKLESL